MLCWCNVMYGLINYEGNHEPKFYHLHFINIIIEYLAVLYVDVITWHDTYCIWPLKTKKIFQVLNKKKMWNAHSLYDWLGSEKMMNQQLFAIHFGLLAHMYVYTERKNLFIPPELPLFQRECHLLVYYG